MTPETIAETSSTITGTLIELADEHELFTDSSGTAYASVRVENHIETWPVNSENYRRRLAYEFFALRRAGVPSNVVETAIRNIAARAQYEGEVGEVAQRVAMSDGKLYIDPGRPQWDVIEVTTESWRVATESPVKFVRPDGMGTLPIPHHGGSMDDLRSVVVVDDEQWRLLRGFLLACFMPKGPYPVLVLQGPQGTGKSLLGRTIKRLVDPSLVPDQLLASDERDLAIAARNSHLLVFDNISRLTGAQSDALCRIASGGGFRTRTLYTNVEETMIFVSRPVILNGITDFVQRPDLADRSITLRLRQLAHRLPPTDLDSRFETVAGGVFGAMLDALVGCVQSCRIGTVTDSELRLAGVVEWMYGPEAIWDEDYGTFESALRRNQHSTSLERLDADPLLGAIIGVLRRKENPWRFTSSELKAELDDSFEESPSDIGSALHRYTPDLELFGFRLTRPMRQAGARPWRSDRCDALLTPFEEEEEIEEEAS